MEAEKELLVFYDFFNVLRTKAGLPLDINQYALFVQLFTRGYAWGDKKGLQRLLKTLWLSSKKHEATFDREFERAFENTIAIARLGIEHSDSNKNFQLETVETPKEKRSSTSDVDVDHAIEPIEDGKGNIDEESPDDDEETFEEEDEKQDEEFVAKTLETQQQAVFLEITDHASTTESGATHEHHSYGSILEHSFILDNHFLPVKERRLQQNWRYLRFKAEKIPGTDIDIAATVERCAREAGFTDFSYASRIKYKQVFHFLIDHEGSMAAFERTAEQLFEAFSASLPSAKAYKWYFHNYPDKALYSNAYHTAGIEIEHWRAMLRKEPAVLFILSDAGAARGGENFERIAATYRWIEEIRPFTSGILWLNPVPRSRWIDSSAITIATFAPMTEISKTGIDRLPDVLKKI